MFKPDKHLIKLKIEEFRHKFSFIGPLHFTDFVNLPIILKEGYLYSRIKCQESSICFLDAADQEIINGTNDHVKDCVRFYYMGTTPTLYNNEGIKINESSPHVPIPVYLLLSDDIIMLKSSFFSDGNAKSKYTKFGTDHEFFSKMDWETIFSRGRIYGYYEKFDIIRKRNAELLSKEPIPTYYIKNIIFRSQADLKRAINRIGQDSRYKVDKSLFHNNRNYIDDYFIEVNNTRSKCNIKITWNFNSYIFREYISNIKIVDSKNNIIYDQILTYPEQKNLSWNIHITDMPKSITIKFYLNNILCVDHSI